MNVTEGTADGASSAHALNGTWRIESTNPTEGRRYRQRFTVHLPTGGLAEGLIVDPSSGFRLRALALTVNALDTDAPERASLSGAGNGIRVRLPIPRLVGSIRFRSSAEPGGKTTQLFRTDGDVIAEEPVASRVHPVAAAGGGAKGVGGVEIATESVAPAQALPPASEAAAGGTGAMSTGAAGSGLPPGELGVIDGNIVVRLTASGGPQSLSTADLSQYNLTTGPENLRVGLSLPDLGDEIFFLPLSFDLNATVDAGEAFRGRLDALLGDLIDRLSSESGAPTPPLLPDPLRVRLAIESDSPCRFQISQFIVNYRLLRESFPDGAPKQVLRFSERPLDNQRIALDVPSGVTFESARLTISGSVSGGSDGASHAAVPALPAASPSGVQVKRGATWASPVTVPTALRVTGCDLVLASLTADAALTLELHRDGDDLPSGEAIGVATQAVSEVLPAKRLRFAFPAPGALLQPGRHWLVLSAHDGDVIWYLTPAPGERILRRDDRRWNGVSALTDHAGVAVLLSEIHSASGADGPAVAFNGQPLNLISSDGDRVYDLGPALTAFGASTLTRGELAIASAAARPITVYPPRLEFEL